MRAGLQLITAPTLLPVTVEDVKAHLRVETADDDDYIENSIDRAIDYIEAGAGVCFMEQEWDQICDSFPYSSAAIELLRWPVTSITSIKYLDGGGQAQTWAATSYILNGYTRPPRVAPTYSQFWPLAAVQTLASVTIRFKAGQTDKKKVPPRMSQALYMLLGHWYENRSDVEVGTIASKVPEGSEEIIEGLRPPMFA